MSGLQFSDFDSDDFDEIEEMDEETKQPESSGREKMDFEDFSDNETPQTDLSPILTMLGELKVLVEGMSASKNEADLAPLTQQLNDLQKNVTSVAAAMGKTAPSGAYRANLIPSKDLSKMSPMPSVTKTGRWR